MLRWPDCVLTTPDVAACSKPSVVSEVVNDLSSSTLRVKVAPQVSLVGLGSDRLGVVSRGGQPDLGVLNPVMAPWEIPAGEALPVPVIDPKLAKPAVGESRPTAVASPVGEVKPVLESSPPASDQPAVTPLPLPEVSAGGGQSSIARLSPLPVPSCVIEFK